MRISCLSDWAFPDHEKPPVGRVPELLFDGQEYVSYNGGAPIAIYDVSEDGQRFLMEQDADTEGSSAFQSQIILVQNWHQELLERVPLP